MKVCLDISPLCIEKPTGVGNYTYNLCNQLIKNNPYVQFTLFSFSPLARLEYMRNHEFSKYPNCVKNIVIPFPAKIARKVYTLWQYANIPPIDQLFPPQDIYHNFDWYTPPISSKTKMVVTVFDLTTVLYSALHKPGNVQLQNLRLKRLLPLHKIITISQATKQDLLKYNPALKTVDVVYPGCNEAFTRVDLPTITGILQKYNLTQPFILTVGTLEPRKNLSSLVKAYLKIQNSIADTLVITGDIGWKNEEFLSYIGNENSQRIKLLPYLPTEELVALYNASHFFAYISLYEGFGIPPLEAMRVGKQVLVSNRSSLPEVVGTYGRMVNPESIDQIATALQQLSHQVPPNTYNQNLINYSQKFSYANSAQQLLELYKSYIQA